jgi:ABC-type multidrug transport system fused ATPase/permease subunit
VDAHTEARIAERVAAHRLGRTTIVTTVSPLWLRHADHVVLLSGGRVVAEGTHQELLATQPDYQKVVVRTLEDSRV